MRLVGAERKAAGQTEHLKVVVVMRKLQSRYKEGAIMTTRTLAPFFFRILLRMYGGPIRLSEARPHWRQLRRFERDGW